MALCSSMDLNALSRERVEGEMKKALLEAPQPSVFFRVLRDMGQLSPWFGELATLIGAEQDPRYHCEGDVWTHTMLVLDRAAELRCRAADPFAFMLAALVHDLGKPLCTERAGEAVHAYGHETLGLPVAEGLLRRITGAERQIQYALNLMELHMKPNRAAGVCASMKSTNRMFDRAVDPEGLICLALADDRGRQSRDPQPDPEPFLRERLEAYRACMARPHVTGQDLIRSGLEPGKGFSQLLAYAHKLRLAGVERESALKQTLAYGRKLK